MAIVRLGSMQFCSFGGAGLVLGLKNSIDGCGNNIFQTDYLYIPKYIFERMPSYFFLEETFPTIIYMGIIYCSIHSLLQEYNS